MHMTMATLAAGAELRRPMSREERKVIIASSVGTVFEWYDFYLAGSLAANITSNFFSGVNPTAGFIFTLLGFAAGFPVRPFGALFFGRLGDILGLRMAMTPADFALWGWRVPFLVSIVLLGMSIWIRLQLDESPAFLKMKAEGTQSKAPLGEAFGRWSNLKVAIVALLGGTAGQAVIWYGGQFYTLFFLTQ